MKRTHLVIAFGLVLLTCWLKVYSQVIGESDRCCEEAPVAVEPESTKFLADDSVSLRQEIDVLRREVAELRLRMAELAIQAGDGRSQDENLRVASGGGFMEPSRKRERTPPIEFRGPVLVSGGKVVRWGSAFEIEPTSVERRNVGPIGDRKQEEMCEEEPMQFDFQMGESRR